MKKKKKKERKINPHKVIVTLKPYTTIIFITLITL